MNSNITITIKKDSLENAKTSPQESKPHPAGQSESVQNGAIRTALIQAGKQMLNYAISQYGNMTGNYITQRKINNLLELSAMATTIAIGGPVGAIAVGVQVGTKFINYEVEKSKSNATASLLFERSGNITRSGGRGTYD